MSPDEIGGPVIAGIALIAIGCIIYFGLRIARQSEEERKVCEAKCAESKANWERRVAEFRQREKQ